MSSPIDLSRGHLRIRSFAVLSPAQSALLDQVNAARERSEAVFAAATVVDVEPFAWDQPDYPGQLAALLRMCDGLASGMVAYCEHRSLSAPEPMFWFGWCPESIRCAACAAPEMRELKRSLAAMRCDLCRLVAPTFIAATLLPGTFNPDALEAIGAIHVTFGLCDACRLNGGDAS
jgi:hypothetical protein